MALKGQFGLISAFADVLKQIPDAALLIVGSAIFIAGILFGGFKACGYSMQAAEGVPIDVVLVVQSLIVLFIAAPPLVRAIFRLPTPGVAPKRETEAAPRRCLLMSRRDRLGPRPPRVADPQLEVPDRSRRLRTARAGSSRSCSPAGRRSTFRLSHLDDSFQLPTITVPTIATARHRRTRSWSRSRPRACRVRSNRGLRSGSSTVFAMVFLFGFLVLGGGERGRSPSRVLLGGARARDSADLRRARRRVSANGSAWSTSRSRVSCSPAPSRGGRGVLTGQPLLGLIAAMIASVLVSSCSRSSRSSTSSIRSSSASCSTCSSTG